MVLSMVTKEEVKAAIGKVVERINEYGPDFLDVSGEPKVGVIIEDLDMGWLITYGEDCRVKECKETMNMEGTQAVIMVTGQAWVDIVYGKVDPAELYNSGGIRFKGDSNALLKYVFPFATPRE